MDLAGKKVAVFGMGRSGFSALKLLKLKKAKTFAVSKGECSSWPNIEQIHKMIGKKNCVEQEEASDCFATSDLIILSPGIPRTHEVLKAAVDKGVPIWSEIELGFRFVPQIPIIAVTGTNGKTTTVTMLGLAIEHSGRSVFVGGNIGTPLCEMILEDKKYDFIVLELSSFQLESMVSFKPDVAMVLNIFANHGERYDGVENYFQAKTHLTDYMDRSSHLIYSSEFDLIDDWAREQNLHITAIKTSDNAFTKEQLEKYYSLEKFKLAGAHNLSNLFFVHKCAMLVGVESGVQQMIDTFCGVEHRVQYVENNFPFIAYNDAKSTNWDATKTAVKAMDKKGRELYLVLGGQKRGRADSILPHLDFLKEHVDRFILIGDTQQMFADELAGKVDFVELSSLEKTVESCKDFQGILLLSPAFPSYDQYKNYIARGEHFIELLTGLDSD